MTPSYDDWLTTPPEDGPICDECSTKQRSKCSTLDVSPEFCAEYWDDAAREDAADAERDRIREEGY
jgi:uncharacterized protein YgiB involved in biofilm formation